MTKNLLIFSLILAAIMNFAVCDAMDSLFLSAGTYKINAHIGNIPLNECSFIAINDKITPFFEDPVSKDPDITSLIISIEDWKVVYSLRKETVYYADAIQVGSMDEFLPSFSIPVGFTEGLYSMVFQIMSGKNVLQRTERDFYYLGDIDFSYEGIDVHLPGIAENTLLVSKGQMVMLEAKVNFDVSLDPYIVWYNGRTRLAEGKHSEGAGYLLWKAPEQSSFYPLRAEIFPVKERDTLAGYQRSVSVLVSSNAADVNLILEKVPELKYWYVFEGNLNDSLEPPSEEHRAIRPSHNNKNKWMASNGTYGLAAGANDIFVLPKVPFAASDTWQILFRCKLLGEGSVFSVIFNASSGVVMDLSVIGGKFVLTLSSPSNKESRIYNLPVDGEEFLTMGLSITTAKKQVFARINVLGETVEEGELALSSVFLETSEISDFQVLLGHLQSSEETYEYAAAEFTAIWDEFALYNNPSMDIVAAEIKLRSAELSSLYE